jgi:PIN domain nuclease of toxin-antitoxin system
LIVLLLDTHVLVWSVEGDERRIGRQAQRLIERAESNGAVLVSPVTLFEITALHVAGRLRLGRPIERWILDALETTSIRIAELSPAVAIDAGHIPRTALEDPVDRLLVATARELEAAFLTGDARILEYASKTRNVRVHDAKR